MPNQHYTVTTFRDYSRELSRFKLFNGAITAVSIAGFLTDYGNLKTALQGVSLGVLARDLWVGDSTNISDNIPASQLAQREVGLRVYYTGDTSSKQYFATVPCADIASLTLVGNTDEVLLADGGIMAALVTAIEAIGRTPDDDTETITVQSAWIVGRAN